MMRFAVRLLALSITVPLCAQTGAQQQTTSAVSQPCSDALQTHAAVVQLGGVRRIFVESFGDDLISEEIQSMIVSSLVTSKKFTVTENRSRADAVLKGAALEKSSQEVHAFGESTAVGSAGGGHSGSISGSVVNGTGTISGSSSGGFAARSAGISDSSLNTETVNEARVSIRLVNSDGDVIWTTTQESKGAKYKGASADVADMCVKQLLRDVSKFEPISATAAEGDRPK